MSVRSIGRAAGGVCRSVAGLFPRWWYVLLFVFLILPLTITFGEDEAKMTVVNKTGHFLHVIMNGDAFLYVAPERSVTYAAESGSDLHMLVDVFYSPGQEVSEETQRSFVVRPAQRASSGCDWDSDGGWDCSSSPAIGGLMVWEVTHDTLLTEPEVER